jgi:hypothetical protein
VHCSQPLKPISAGVVFGNEQKNSAQKGANRPKERISRSSGSVLRFVCDQLGSVRLNSLSLGVRGDKQGRAATQRFG